ncbi:tyrosine-type recombinase/integrase [Myroides odoratimimus]|uniref:site-specific integrase n=1 Tax=Myroides odoratimimus TaxID=76832 RepID=UPI0024C08962|nr:site-specific integrase [Myroides odoratimimus]WHT72894.1 tyrosine-type recombinase/integrase [Myroides odoratimimus]WHU37478.1 tyrosine-type recombinase/integrase [Myroides odoratimimus]
MTIKRKVTFAIEKRKKDNILVVENVPIRARVVYNGGRVELFTGYRIDAPKWDEHKERVRNGCTNRLKQSSSEINTAISELSTIIDRIFKEFELKNEMPSFEIFKDEVKRYSDKQTISATEKNLFTAFDEFVKSSGKRNDWTDATYTKFNTVRSHLSNFKSNFQFSDINEKVLLDYVTFLREKKLMRNSTIDKQISFLKWFLKWCRSNNYTIAYNFESFKPKLKETSKRIIFLTQEELEKIKAKDLSDKPYLDRVRDVLLFCCYTGLRYSDAYNLTKQDINNDVIEFVTKKTNDLLRVELNKHSRAILDKYKDVPFEDDKALPVISNQKMNDYVKTLGQEAGIDEPIRETYYQGNKRIDEVKPKHEHLSTHVGRRTFICTALSLGIPVQVVMKWTGHSDYKSMKPYIDVADTIKANAMTKFDTI